MGFSTLSFQFLFLPAVSVGYYLLKPKFANCWLLLASLYYYWLIAPDCLPLLLAVALTAYLVGLSNRMIRSAGLKKVFLWLGTGILITVLLGLRAGKMLGHAGNNGFPFLLKTGISGIPIGSSFFILQAVMYMVDTYKGEESVANPIDLGLYISFFPKIVSGPLLKYRHFRERKAEEFRTFDLKAVSEGAWRIGTGICKKILIANQLGNLAGTLFVNGNLARFSVLQIWLCVLAYSLQIFLDFSAYSDIAIGTAGIFGYTFPENFNTPYTAGSLKEFWRRWHISLSAFFRDYVYIPLGGNRHGKKRWILSMAAVWLLTGLWHGITWNFMVWSIAHGIFLIAETLFIPQKSGHQKPKWIGHVYTLLAVMLLWVVFRSESLGQAAGIITGMFGAKALPFVGPGFWFLLKNNAAVLLLGFLACVPAQSALMQKLRGRKWYRIAATVTLLIGTAVSIAYMFMNGYQPFVYTMF